MRAERGDLAKNKRSLENRGRRSGENKRGVWRTEGGDLVKTREGGRRSGEDKRGREEIW